MAEKTLGVVELEWTCPNCGVKNPGSSRTCSGCGSPQPDDVAFQMGEHQELITDAAKVAEAAAGADIHCGYCGARNPAGAEVCVQCGAELKEGKKRASGQVLGAFKEGAPEQVACPRCGAMNPENVATCRQCGGPISRPKAAPLPPKQTPTQPNFVRSPLGMVGIGGIILLLIMICCLLGWYFTRTEASVGTVQGSQWERLVMVESIHPVTHETWKDQVPPVGKLGTCTVKERVVQDQPAPNATEVCGTPFVVDTGSGKGQVKQECEYHVYDESCEYTMMEWGESGQARLTGVNSDAIWPEPTIVKGQRLGTRQETYKITFESGGKTYQYTTQDFHLFEECATGSKWTLNINTLGSVVSISPVK